MFFSFYYVVLVVYLCVSSLSLWFSDYLVLPVEVFVFYLFLCWEFVVGKSC